MKSSLNSLAKSILAFILISILIFEHSQSLAQADANPKHVIPKEKILGLSIKINAPLDSVWTRWTTEKGSRKFFAPACNLELKPLGKLEILFAPDAPAGQRGAENNFILAIQDKNMLSITWDAPPQ